VEAGSIDPLGYQAEADAISEAILPGITVFTSRIRYLSFLCWAVRTTGANRSSIDRWDVALSIGEYQRHDRGDGCKYPGVLLLEWRELNDNDPVPSRLHTPPVQQRYLGLARSCGFVNEEEKCTATGETLADYFGKDVPGTLPKVVWACRKMPCLSLAGGWEKRHLHEGLLETTEQAKRRNLTFREIGKHLLGCQGPEEVIGPVLRHYLRSTAKTETARELRRAAMLEMEALPLTRLFYYLYRHGDHLAGKLPIAKRLQLPYSIRPPSKDPEGFLQDIAAHLQRLERLGGPEYPRDLEELKQKLLERHYSAKGDGPWVDDEWRPLRKHLALHGDPKVHGYRLAQFASLLRDLGEL
jgi:hypothetical protein